MGRVVLEEIEEKGRVLQVEVLREYVEGNLGILEETP